MKTSRTFSLFNIINSIFMILIVLFTLYPFVYLVAQSFSSEAAIYAGSVSIFPVEFTTKTYQVILSKPDFFLYYWNTLVYSVIGTFIAVAATAVMSYPLSKDKLRLNKFLFPSCCLRCISAADSFPTTFW